MSDPSPLTPDEEAVFREFQRLDVEPNGIPAELFEGFLKRLAESTSLSLEQVTAATRGLIDKGKFDTSDKGKEG